MIMVKSVIEECTRELEIYTVMYYQLHHERLTIFKYVIIMQYLLKPGVAMICFDRETVRYHDTKFVMLKYYIPQRVKNGEDCIQRYLFR